MNGRTWPSTLTRLAFASVAVLPLTGCEWFTDFKRTPMVTTWEADSILKVRGAPVGSVPTTGMAVAAFQVSYTPSPAALDSVAALATNPTPVSEASLARGRMYFQINCAVCHGDTGKGDGGATRFGMVPMPIVAEVTKARSDGYLFAILRNGRGAMPSYNRIEEMERWDVVNYVRALQGTVTGVPFETGPLALPGVSGDKVPGATLLGPNHWVRPTSAAAPAASATPAPADSGAAAPQGAR
ncbi:MAG: cytochrome c [Gemmatimonadaceae bacterium]|nr:cytochrome c [Gemmatimonadaceae bacterium]